MVNVRPFRVQLLAEIAEIESEICNLQQRTTISQFRNDPGSMVVFIGPRYHWNPLPPSERGHQAEILGRYRRWFELVSRCYANYSSDIKEELKRVDEFVTETVELKGGWNVEATHENNRQVLDDRLEFCRGLLEAAGNSPARLVIVPDTNALLSVADPTRYRQVAGCDQFEFVLVPTVLSELDQIKVGRRDKELGEKAQKVIQRLKGYRNQGSVRNGVTVDKSIAVRMVSAEPRMAELPDWLDPQNADDRILGTILQIQFSDLSAAVLLVTNDLNLQNKAEMAFLPWVEPPG